MTEPNAREMELAAAIRLDCGNWTHAIAKVLAAYRVELTEKIVGRLSIDGHGTRRHYAHERGDK